MSGIDPAISGLCALSLALIFGASAALACVDAAIVAATNRVGRNELLKENFMNKSPDF